LLFASPLEELRAIADAVICATTPERFSSVGEWYDEFSQITDDEVREALARQRRPEERLQPAAPVIS